MIGALGELDKCVLFVQLLSGARGKELSFAPSKRLPSLQHMLACRAGKPVLQWRDKTVDVQHVADPDHRGLLDAAQACGIEEFKQRAASRAKEVARPTNGGRVLSAGIFVNADVPDHGLALEISRRLCDLGVDCYWTPQEGSPKEVRLSVEDSLKNCDGLVLVYGETHLDWVQQQLRLARKMSGERESPLATLAIFEGPPPAKSEIPATIKNLVVLDCQSGLDQDKLRQFAAHLHG